MFRNPSPVHQAAVSLIASSQALSVLPVPFSPPLCNRITGQVSVGLSFGQFVRMRLSSSLSSALALAALPQVHAFLRMRGFDPRQLPAGAEGVKTIVTPGGATMRYKEPGKMGVCETTPGVNSFVLCRHLALVPIHCMRRASLTLSAVTRATSTYHPRHTHFSGSSSLDMTPRTIRSRFG